MSNYKIVELGEIEKVEKINNSKVFLHDKLELTSCEISINCVPAGFKLPFDHKHIENEEVYIFLKGTDLFTVDKKDLKVQEGNAIRVASEASRTIFNNSNEFLQFICIQAKQNSLKQFGLKDAIAN